jgi:hypothetical protein
MFVAAFSAISVAKKILAITSPASDDHLHTTVYKIPGL